MGWANYHIEKLKAGESVQFRPHGNSMQPKIKSGQLCTVEPIKDIISIDDMVLCKVRGKEYLHLVKAIKGDQYQIGNNHGYINGWTSNKSIFGKVVKVED